MNQDLLPQLLTDADSRLPKPPLQADLENRVIHRIRHRRVIRRSAAVALLVVAAIPVIVIKSGSKPSQTAKSPSFAPPIAITQPKPDRWEALVHEETADAMLRMQHERADPTATTRRINIEMERLETAAVLLAAGDHFAHQGNSPQRAKDAYQRVVAFFPGTPCATTANQRLAQPSF